MSCGRFRGSYLFQVNVGNDDGRLENDAVTACACVVGIYLFREVSYVVRQAKEMLFIRFPACFTGDTYLASAVVVSDRAEPLDQQNIFIRDSVIEHDTPVNL